MRNKPSQYHFNEMSFKLEDTVTVGNEYTYLEGKFRIGNQVFTILKCKEINGKVIIS